MITKTDLQAVLDEMTAEDRRTRVEPPTVEEMLAWRRGELSDEDEARVREQLICWPELLRALMTPYPDDDAGALPAAVVERQWQAMRRETGSGGGARVLSFRNAITAIAASLAVVFGALLWQAELKLRRPRALPQQLLLPDAQRGASDGATTLPTDGDDYLLTLGVISEQRFEFYQLELVDASNRTVWRSGALHHGEDDTFAVLVPRSFLAPGRYKVMLYGVNGGRQEELGSYSVRVAPR